MFAEEYGGVKGAADSTGREVIMARAGSQIGVAVSLLLAASSLASGTDLSQKLETRDGFSISLPADWVQIPREVLVQRLSSMGPGAIPDHAFQVDAGGQWLVLPYCFIQVRKVGRPPESSLTAYDEIKKGFASGMAQVKGEGGVLSDDSVSEMTYDQEAQLLLATTQLNVPGVGMLKSLWATKPTEEGVITMHFMATADEFEGYKELFESVARSIEVDDAIAYKARAASWSPPSGTRGDAAGRRELEFSRRMGQFAAFLIFAAIVAVVVSMARRKKPPKARREQNGDFPTP